MFRLRLFCKMNIFFGVFAMLFCMRTVYCARTTTISDISRKSVKDIGDTAKLTCSVFNPMNYSISWLKVDKNENATEPTVISKDNEVFFPEPKFSIRQDIVYTEYYERNCYTLQILNFQLPDAGVYRCNVLFRPNDTLTADTEIEARVPPAIVNVSRSLIVGEGALVTLECHVTGVPEPIVTWRRENGAILVTGEEVHRGNVLEFKSIRKADRGFYQCYAENGVGKNVRRNVHVVIEFSPVLTTDKQYKGQALKYYVDFHCNVEAYPSSTIVWTHKGVELSNDQYYTITNLDNSEETTDSLLRIHIFSKQQYGDYECKATNILGSDQLIFNLYETYKTP